MYDQISYDPQENLIKLSFPTDISDRRFVLVGGSAPFRSAVSYHVPGIRIVNEDDIAAIRNAEIVFIMTTGMPRNKVKDLSARCWAAGVPYATVHSFRRNPTAQAYKMAKEILIAYYSYSR